MNYRSIWPVAAVTCLWLGGFAAPFAIGQEDVVDAEIRAVAEKATTAFNAGRAEEVAALFLEKGEFIDEEGTVYQGQQEIKDLFTAFFEKFPGTTMANKIESIRLVGPVAIQEGARTTTTQDGASTARIRYIAVCAKTEAGWRLASLRDFADESIPTAGEMLRPLEWLIGDWINEGADAQVKISYRWSEDKNFILGDFLVTKGDQVTMKSTQRIGWDPLLGQARSWLFDSDGGFSDATWTQVDDSWIVRSAAVLPDGQTGSAFLTVAPGENGRFVMTGTNRIVGNLLEDDYEITVVKQPPTASK